MRPDLIDRWAAVQRAALLEAHLFRTRLVPPPDLTVSEWADRYRVLSREASAEPGRWQTARAPYLRGIMDACSEPMIEQVVVMSSAQVGKTEVVLNVIGYYVDQDPAPILTLQPTEKMGEAFSKDRLATMIRDTPRLRSRFPDPRSRDSGNTLLHKVFPGGHITISGANSAASLASRPIRVVLADEVDRYPPSAGTEGDPVNLAVKRTATFWNRKLVLTSTPTMKGFSRIEAAFLDSDQRHYHVPCPHCSQLQILTWAHLRWEEGDPETAAYVCEHCGAVIEEEHKPAMLAAGVWVADEPGRRIAGFHLNALYSPWARWAELVREFLAAKKIGREALKVWVNTVLGETWEEDGESVSPEGLAARKEPHERGTVPAWAGVLTAAVDVQGDRLELLVQAWGAGEEAIPVHFEQLWGDPGRDDVWHELERHLTREFRHASGEMLRISAACIDTGGHHTEMVYRFCKPRAGRRVWATKGHNQPGRPILGRPSQGNKYRVKLFPIGTDTAKDLIFSRLRLTERAPGYLHIPDWIDREWLEQLTAERVVTRYHKGRPIRAYEKTRPRNEALDLEVLALAALLSLGTQTTQRLGVIAEELAAKGRVRGVPEPEEPEGSVVREVRAHRVAPPRKGGWVNGWR